MKKMIFVFVLLLLANTSYATEPCLRPNEKWFRENVLIESDTVIYGKVLDYSNKNPLDIKNVWTKIEVIERLLGSNLIPKNITILEWQAHQQPLYPYQKGDYLLLWLKKNGENYHITNMSWQYCIPSIWNAKSDKTAYDVIQNHWTNLSEVQSFIKLYTSKQ